ncbi:MAG: tannase/feruloyl esterase family alpha/beta hydrolase [Gammaproteobacteria bacterium]
MQFKQQALLATLALLSPAAFAAVTPCASLVGLKVPGYDVTIKQAAVVPAGAPPASPVGGPPLEGTLPSYCRVDGTIDERMGSDGKPYAIGFAVALPENWNGRFLFQGGGGLNGNVGLPIGAAALDADQHVLPAQRQAHFLSRPQRSVVFGKGHDSLLHPDDCG